MGAVTVIHVRASQSERKWQYIGSTDEICKKKNAEQSENSLGKKTKRHKYIFDRSGPRILDYLLHVDS